MTDEYPASAAGILGVMVPKASDYCMNYEKWLIQLFQKTGTTSLVHPQQSPSQVCQATGR